MRLIFFGVLAVPALAFAPTGCTRGTAVVRSGEVTRAEQEPARYELFPTGFAGFHSQSHFGRTLTAIRDDPSLQPVRAAASELAGRSEATAVFVHALMSGTPDVDLFGQRGPDRAGGVDRVSSIHVVVIGKRGADLEVMHNLQRVGLTSSLEDYRYQFYRELPLAQLVRHTDTCGRLTSGATQAVATGPDGCPELRPRGADAVLPATISWDAYSVAILHRVGGGSSQTVAGVNALREDDAEDVAAFNRDVERMLARAARREASGDPGLQESGPGVTK